jgi:hypothetical protein
MSRDKIAKGRWRGSVPLFLSVLIALAACDSGSGDVSEAGTDGSTPGASPSPSGRSSRPAEDGGFDPANFDAGSAIVDNPWFLLEPGTRYV